MQILPSPALVLDGKDFKVIFVNKAFLNAFHSSLPEVERRRIYELAEGAWDTSSLHQLLEEHLVHHEQVSDFPIDQNLPGSESRRLRIMAERITFDDATTSLLLLIVENSELSE